MARNMLGRHHLLLSVGTVSIVLAPVFATYPLLVMIAISGTAIGSLIPDADSEDAAIFHTKVRGIGGSRAQILQVLGIVYPVFGYATKYLIYKPSVIFYDRFVFEGYDIRERHRGYLHSFIGIGTTTVLTGLYMVPVLVFLELFSVIGLAVFLVGYVTGAGLHLVEDSCTRTGIQWNYPFHDWKLKGQITTTTKPEDTRYQRGFLVVMGMAAVGMFLLWAVLEAVPLFVFPIGGALLAIVLWLIFARFVAKCRVS